MEKNIDVTRSVENDRGKFIVLDGVDGSGKSTQIKELKKRLGEEVLITREPGGSVYAEEIRELILNSPNAAGANALTMFALFWAARADHLERIIKPALKEGKTVISDRFDSATFSHQIYGQQARELEDFFWKMRERYLSDCAPDLYIFIDIDPAEALARKEKGRVEHNHFDEREIEFHDRVRTGLKVFSERVNVQIIDGAKSIEEITAEVLRQISSLN